MSAAEPTESPATLDGQCFRPGDVVGGRYQLLDCIGSGAMGAVYRAHDRLLDAEVAIKLLRLDVERSDRERAVKRLLVEARAIARLSHPGIVRVFDFGGTEAPFIVMELLEGETLGALLARDGLMDPVTAVGRTLAIADALAVAHRRGVVHRDVKPENVFLARDEFGRIQPKLVDFGVARLRERGSGLTRPGVLMGTPDYMAPEQARAEPDVDQRADVWSFAVVLYELVTGQRPFVRENASYLAVLRAIVSEPPVPITLLGTGDAALWAILEKALAKRASDRFASMRDLGAALAGWLLSQGVTEDAYGASLRTVWLEPACPPSVSGRMATRAEPATLPRAEDHTGIGRDDTLPPPAIPARNLRPIPVRGDDDKRPFALPSRRSAEHPGGRTLESASLQRFTPLQLALASALAAAIVTAGITWALVRPGLPVAPESTSQAAP